MPMPPLARVAAAASIAFALVGCVAVVQPPPPPDAVETANYNELMLDETWLLTNLDDSVPRPPADLSAEPLEWDQWVNGVFECMAAAGITDASIGSGPGQGYTLGSAFVDEEQEADAQYAFYVCASRHPVKGTFTDHPLISDAQIDYLYDHYARTVVPCLEAHGYGLVFVPTREQFHEAYGEWTPYQSVSRTLQGMPMEPVALCGAEQPGLE